jgi:hypothetical protein
VKTKDSELLEKAQRQTRRNEHGGFVEIDLITNLKSLITIDVEAEAWRKAKSIIDQGTKPGSTEETDRQLRMPGLEPYFYEASRLIRDGNGNIIEQDKATPAYKLAELARATKHLHEVTEWAMRKRKETKEYIHWETSQRKKGRTANLAFGDFVREAGFLEVLTPSQ